MRKSIDLIRSLTKSHLAIEMVSSELSPRSFASPIQVDLGQRTVGPMARHVNPTIRQFTSRNERHQIRSMTARLHVTGRRYFSTFLVTTLVNHEYPTPYCEVYLI